MADYPNARDCEHGRLRRSCEQCSDAFLIAALEARLAEVEGALRSVAQHPCYDVREWAGEAIPCGFCPSCVAAAVLDNGEPVPRLTYREWLATQERCPTCRSPERDRQQGLPHSDLDHQLRCRDPWHTPTR